MVSAAVTDRDDDRNDDDDDECGDECGGGANDAVVGCCVLNRCNSATAVSFLPSLPPTVVLAMRVGLRVDAAATRVAAIGPTNE